MKPQSFATVAFAIGVACASSHGPRPPAASEEGSIVTVVGCITPGVEAGCRVLTTAEGALYSLHTDARAGEDRAYRVRGEIGGADTCMQGTVLVAKPGDVIRLEVKCPL